MRRLTLCFTILFFLLSGCASLPALPVVQNPPAQAQPTFADSAPTLAPEGDALAVFFTHPGDPAGAGDLERALLDSLHGAKNSIDVAMYNFSLRSAADALIDAVRRGVKVRAVLDSDAMDGRAIERLQAGGVELIGDRRESLMHNKFIVIDGELVWTGSLNLTETGMANDNNNFVRLRSADLARLYTDEFNEMFEKDIFSGGSPIPAGQEQVQIGQTQVEVYFAPDDHPSKRLIQLVRGASSSVDFLAYIMTLNGLRDALLSAHKSGLRVRGVFDAGRAGALGSDYDALLKAGVDVRLDGIQGLMHHKVIIIDEETVLLGSYNFTQSADETNDENLLVIHDAAVARQFINEFDRVFGAAK
jgi:phosphatidylserine/phosphatidylglycerophosphate/cardiolipin synthase-like enzyme